MRIRILGCLMILLGGVAMAQSSFQSNLSCEQTLNKKPADWAQFHFDPCHASYNPYETVLSAANVGKLVLAWQAGPSSISSSLTIGNGVLYYGTNDGSVHGLDALTGRGVWGASTIDGSVGTPAVAEGKVYVNVMTDVGGTIFALSAVNGNPLWNGNDYGFPFDVTVADGAVYVTAGYQGMPPSSELYALDATTGGLVWRYHERNSNSLYMPAVAGGMAYAGCEVGFCAFDAATGLFRWQYSTPQGYFFAPALSNSVVYVGATRFTSSTSSIYVDAFDPATGILLWQSPVTGIPDDSETFPLRGTPAVGNDGLYVATYKVTDNTFGRLYAIDARTGAHLWHYQTSGPINSSASLANGVVYFGSEDMNLYALDARTGGLLWKYTTTGPIEWSPAIVNGMLYVSDGKYIYAFHLPKQ